MSATAEDTTQAAPDPVAPVAEPVACRTCGAAMEPGQDWCLSCGTAAPGRLGGRPGWRAVNAVALVTVLLVAGAIAAGYAALSGDATTDAGRQATAGAAPVPGQVAQLPDAPPAPVTTAPAPAVTKPRTPKIPVVPVRPATPVTPVTPVVPVTPAAPGTASRGPSTVGPGTSTGPAPGTGHGSGSGTTTGAPKPPTPASTPIKIASGDLAAYDPSSRIKKAGDPGSAADGDKTTAWSVTTPDDGYPMQVGLLVDLRSPKAVRELQLGTTTPGGRVEIYGASGSALPPDILDTRWEHIASRSKVDQTSIAGNTPGDRTERIHLLQGGGKFRYVLVWFTEAPRAGPTVRVTEIGLDG